MLGFRISCWLQEAWKLIRSPKPAWEARSFWKRLKHQVAECKRRSG